MIDTDAENCLDTVKDKSAITGVENSVVSTKEVIPVDEKSSNGLQDNEPSETHEFPLKKVVFTLFQPIVFAWKCLVCLLCFESF